MEYGYGTVGNTSVHHIVLGGWKGDWAQYGNAKVNHPACAPAKRCARVIKDPDPDRLCRKCVRILTKLEEAEQEKQAAVAAATSIVSALEFVEPVAVAEPEPVLEPVEQEPVYAAAEYLPAERQFVTVKRRECFVVHPYQRDILTPPWPKRWGAFDLEKFYASLEPVTVIDASLVTGLKENRCEDHGLGCDYTAYDEAKYIVLGGQHRTQEGGRVFGPDWEFKAVELVAEVKATDLARRWWITEDRRNPGTRALFDKRVHDGAPEYVAMAEHLVKNNFTWRRDHARKSEHLLDFTSIGTLPVLWNRDEGAARVMVDVLGRAGDGYGPGVNRLTRMPLIRAIFEMAKWDLNENEGIRVRWAQGYGSMAGKLKFLAARVTYYENAIGVSGATSWQRVANSLAEQYNKGRSTGYVNFPTF